MTADGIQSVALRLPNWVGDVVMATPSLRSLRLGYPGARICLVGKPGMLEIVQGLPYYDEVIPVRGKGVGKVLSTAALLRKQPMDLGILLPNSFSTALSFFLGRVRRRTGYALNGRDFLLHRSIRPVMEGLKRRPEPMTRYYLRLVAFAGGAETDEGLELRTDPTLDREVVRFLEARGLADGHPLVGLNPGASFGPSKRWTSEGFAALADRVHEELGGRTMLLCGPGEEEIADAIRSRARHPPADTSRSVFPLAQLKSAVARLDALVTTDTGPRHFAAALGVPVVVIMGPTDPRYTAYHTDLCRVLRLEIDCGPCHKKVCDTDHRCMAGITGDQVFEALKELLRKGAGEPKAR